MFQSRKTILMVVGTVNGIIQLLIAGCDADVSLCQFQMDPPSSTISK